VTIDRLGEPAAAGAWAAVAVDEVIELRERLARDEYLLSAAPAGSEQLQRWGRFSGGEIRLVEIRQGAKSAEMRLRSLELGTPGEDPAASLAGRATTRPRPLLIAFSGLDGAGKSTQSLLLKEIFEWIGMKVDIFWLPLGHSPFQRRLRTWKRAARRLRPPRSRQESSNGQTEVSQPGSRRLVGRAIWPVIVSVVYAITYRWAIYRRRNRFDVLIFDRFVVDAAAQLGYFYGDGGNLFIARTLLRRLSPKPDLAYLFDLDGAEALARKVDGYDLDQLRRQASLLRREAARANVTIVDATRSAHEIALEVAGRAWRLLGVE
jgi:thymidylate kinase